MGFLDKAKKLAGQAKELAEQAKDAAEGALAEAKERKQQAEAESAASSGTGESQFGTPYTEGMLGRPGWREQGLPDPAALLPIAERDRVGVPRSTKSVILEEPFGMGRRWSSGERSAALFYQLYDEHRSWQPPGGTAPFADVAIASTAALDDGRSLVFLSRDDRRVVLEVNGLDDAARATLARAVADQLASV
jgi:hypothetical protein